MEEEQIVYAPIPEEGEEETKAVEPVKTEQTGEEQVISIVSGIAKEVAGLAETVGVLSKTVKKLDQHDKEDRREERSKGYVAPETPPDIVGAVHEILGEEYGVDVKAIPDRPAYMLTIVVPEKYSELKCTATYEEKLRKKELEQLIPQTKEKKVRDGLYEELMTINDKIPPEDRRSCIISYADGLPKVKDWATRVKFNVHRRFQLAGKAMPE